MDQVHEVHEVHVNNTTPCLALGRGHVHGDLLLVVDADSRVPTGFLAKAVQLFKDPKLGYTQHSTDPLPEMISGPDSNYFSRGISEFTTALYEVCFRLTTRNGDISPLIGHHILLRTSALRSLNRGEQWWAEDRVSEDFHMCLELHNAGFTGKYVQSSTHKFHEGVALCYADEISKYCKFAYGASEIVFNPRTRWRSQGLLTPEFKSFLRSSVPWTSKIGILAYLTSYFTVAAVVPLLPASLVVSAFSPFWHAAFFSKMFDTWLTMTFLFFVLAPISSVCVRVRLGLVVRAKRELVQVLFLALLFGSSAVPIFWGICSHLCNLGSSWGSTRKSLESTTDPKFRLACSIVMNDKFRFVWTVVTLGLAIGLSVVYPTFVTHWIPLVHVFGAHLLAPFIFEPRVFSQFVSVEPSTVAQTSPVRIHYIV